MQRATAVARVAAGRAGVTMKELHEPSALRRAVDLFGQVWRTRANDPQIAPALLRAFTHTGNFVAGAFDGDEMVAASVGFYTAGPVIALHSHLTCVAPGRQGCGLGYALKLYQRAWALERGVEAVTWTFDPLVARNAFLNLTKLGARASAYVPDFYGGMLADDINTGDENDRLVVTWSLASPDVVAATEGRPPPLSMIEPDGSNVLLDEDRSGGPRLLEADGDLLTCRIPRDVIRLRDTDLILALRWRHTLRAVLQDRLLAGYRIGGFTRSSYYVLTAGHPHGGDSAAGA